MAANPMLIVVAECGLLLAWGRGVPLQWNATGIFSMSRRDIIADDLLTGRILTLGLSVSSLRGFVELKLHINMATGLTCPLVKLKEICLLHGAEK